MEIFKISLFQVSAKGKTSFSAVAKIRLNDEINDFTNEVSNFCKDTVDFVNRSKNRGVNINGIKKSQKLTMKLETLEGNEVLFELTFRNFGKFVENTSLSNLKAQIKDSATYQMKYSQFIN